MATITHPTIFRYAERIGADFLSITESKCSTPHWEKFRIFDLLNQYHRILFVDTDIIIRSDAPNLFDLVPENKIGVFNEMPFTGPMRFVSLVESCREYGIKNVPEKFENKYYNTGVLVVSRRHKFLFKKPEKEFNSHFEQGYLNVIFSQHADEMFDLEYRFNRMSCLDSRTGEERHASYFIHYAGAPDFAQTLQIIQADLARWKDTAPEYRYQRHILLDVQGGLGDQVDAEPTIRFLLDHIYPEEDVNIKTHFPRLFSHLQHRAKIWEHSEFRGQPDTPYWHCVTLPGPETSMWAHVSNLMCHTVDYISQAVLKRALPVEDRRIKLEVFREDIEEAQQAVGRDDLENLILVHPGRHWDSKTFPLEWWQAVMDGLQKSGQRVCIIGQEDETRGTLAVIVREGTIDTRDLLSLGGLIGLISEAKVLISNDSAPIHIAGAFDNRIILIPTCKHPDHVLPYRPGGQYANAIALYKRLTIDDCRCAPTEVHAQSAEFIHKNWDEYLPDPNSVAEAVNGM